MMYTFAFWICFSVCFDLHKAIPFISVVHAYCYALFIYAFDSLFIIRGHCLGKVFPTHTFLHTVSSTLLGNVLYYTLLHMVGIAFQLVFFTK